MMSEYSYSRTLTSFHSRRLGKSSTRTALQSQGRSEGIQSPYIQVDWARSTTAVQKGTAAHLPACADQRHAEEAAAADATFSADLTVRTTSRMSARCWRSPHMYATAAAKDPDASFPRQTTGPRRRTMNIGSS